MMTGPSLATVGEAEKQLSSLIGVCVGGEREAALDINPDVNYKHPNKTF